ncbi:hypothetical protein SAMN04489712_109268 [Thermomonospora echinospora]|uniref:Lipopolysaccharide assembly protein A domain-containing protein n=1 Tax=Thermomonospora echinospora TaxID=1992 RepID=A0A1H6CEX0_9ACTN|nr:hypothetical protein [Thermomonospora echinospora]SEG71412.1 hypothetical protein SAMN04489712_109268 [Thermomonospora echinospora]
MIFLGLLVTAAALATGIAVVLANDGAAQLSAFGEPVPGVTAQWHVFIAGVVVATVFIAGLTAFMFGVNRSVRTRRELRYLREEHEESITALEMEKRQLQRELARARREAASGAVAPPPQAPHQPVPQ